jgi:hypothetical protein
MTITIAPFTINTSCNYSPLPIGRDKEEHTERDHRLLLTGESILIINTYPTLLSKELAERTKVWIEKWLKDRLEI